MQEVHRKMTQKKSRLMQDPIEKFLKLQVTSALSIKIKKIALKHNFHHFFTNYLLGGKTYV